MNKPKRAFIVLTHTYQVNNVGKWEVSESCEFLSSLKNRHHSESTAIIDFKNQHVVKNRAGNNDVEAYNALISHLDKTYPNEMSELREVFKGED